MKHFIFIIILLSSCLLVTAQKKYEVTTNTFLNIRSYASTEAPVIGTIDNGGEVDVYEISNGWAKISYNDGFAYVSSQYLKESISNEVVSKKKNSNFKFDVSSLTFGNGGVEWMVFAIAGISVILLIIRKRRGDDPLEGTEYSINWILFLTVSILELVYISLMGSDTIWFCIPDKVGWLWTIIDFIIFGFVVYNQIMCYFNTLVDVEYNSGGGFDKRWGLYSWAGGIITAILSGIFFPTALPFILIAFIICQLIQIVLIFKGTLSYGGVGNAFLCTAVYLLGSLASILILAHFVVLLIIVLVAYFILSIIGKTSSSRGCCRSCSHYSGGYCNYHGMYISSPDSKTCDYYR